MLTLYVQRFQLNPNDPSPVEYMETDDLPKDMALSLNYYPENSDDSGSLHPEGQVKLALELIQQSKEITLGHKIDVRIVTNSIIFLYVVNNALLKDPTLEVQAFECDGQGKKSLMQGRQIDESVLGWVMDRLATEQSQIIAQVGRDGPNYRPKK